MNMFNTNSTTVMQSKLLLGLGIDPWTADLTLHDEERDIPLWSMMRLIDMIPGFIVDDDGYTYSFTISKGTYVYNLSYTRKTKHGEKTLISFHNPKRLTIRSYILGEPSEGLCIASLVQ